MKILEKLKEKLPKKLFTKKALIIAVIVTAVVGFAAFKLLKPKNVPMGAVPETRTTVLEKTSLVNSISVSGTVKSINVVNVTTSLTYKVKEILVQVGDTVKKGDIIAKLDSEDITKSIAEEHEKLNEAKATAQEALNKAITKKEESEADVASAENTNNKDKTTMDVTRAPYHAARDSITVQQKEYDTAFAAQQAAGLAMNNAYDKRGATTAARIKAEADAVAAQTALDVATTAYKVAKAASDAAAPTDPALTAATAAAKLAMDTAHTANEAAKIAAAAAIKADIDAASPFTVAEKAYNDAKAIADSALAALNAAKAASNLTALQATFDAADRAEEASRAILGTAIKMRDADNEAYRAAQKAFDKAGTSTVLEELDKKLKECTIKAETNGVITAINAVVGSAMGQSANAGTGPLAVIQDTDNLVISTSFREYDIANIAIGQKVTIKSDATADKVITGYVSQISMTASSGQSGEVAFPAEIRIETADSGLLVGMNAKADVILSQKDNIFVVPDDAIGTNEKGESIVYLQSGAAYNPIVVTTGVSNDFYTEIISSELIEGAVVRSNASEGGSLMMNGTGGDVIMGGAPMGGGSTTVMVG